MEDEQNGKLTKSEQHDCRDKDACHAIHGALNGSSRA